MRLIDGDGLWERLNYEPWEHNADRDEIALPFVNAAPTIDAEIVVHGRWEDSTDDWLGTDVYTCSKCRESYVLVEGTPKENLWHYCPNCGAKMDGNWKQTT